MFIIITAVTIVFGFNQVNAQQDVAGYLEARLQRLGVPVIEIKTIQDFPLQIEVTLQSASDGVTGVPEDPIYLLLLDREMVLARQKGYFIDRFIRRTIGVTGEQISYSETRVKIFENIFLDSSPSQVSDTETAREITSDMRLFGLSVAEMNISSENGLQSLFMNVVSPSIESANTALPEFMKSLRPTIDRTNEKGSHIVIFRLELRDAGGKILLNYIRDLQLSSERWWMDEKLTTNWFSIPVLSP